MISTSLKNQNNYIPSQISNLYVDIYAQMSTLLNGSLVDDTVAFSQQISTFGGVLGVTNYSVNNGKPTYIRNPPRVTNYAASSSSATMPSLGTLDFFNNASPPANFYDFTIFGVLNVLATSHPGGAFMNTGNSSIWVCAGSNLPVLTNSTSAILSGTTTTGLHVITIRQNGTTDFSVRIDNNTILSSTARYFTGATQLGLGRYNTNIVYSSSPNNFRRLIAYRKALSTDEIIRVRNYLSVVYGTLAYA